MNVKKSLILLGIVVVLGLMWAFDVGQYLNLSILKAQHATLLAQRAESPLMFALLFGAVYIVATALSLPGATLLTLAGGAIFGLFWGTVLVSFASSIGATLSFLLTRFVFADWVRARWHERLTTINQGVARDGAFYLFTMRMVPIFPFFLVNVLFALTSIKTRTFYGVSQLGMLAGTVVYVNAGTQLSTINSIAGILSPSVLLAFALLGIFPILTKQGISMFQTKKLYARWKKPAAFDRNLVVIGGGSAGLVSAYIAAAVKAKVTLIEKHRMGGDCLNTGCVPSKAILRSAKFLSHLKRAGEFGIKSAHAEVNFAEVMQRVHRVVNTVAPHDSIERYQGLGVEVIEGEATLISPWEVAVRRTDGQMQTITTKNIIIAAGARPTVPPIPGLESVGYLTSDTVWSLTELPQRMVVLGGGPIGCEMTQAFARLGAQVTQVEQLPRIMIREDTAVSTYVTERFRAEGITVLTEHKAKAFEMVAGEKTLIAETKEGREVRIPFDAVLVAVGRSANLKGYGLEELGVKVSRTIDTNGYLQTNYPNIYAAGDVAGPYQFTHTAAHQAWFAVVNALFSPFKKFKVDYSVIPWATFTEPEVARVGINEQEAVAQGIAFEVTHYGLDDLDRAIADSEAHGWVQVITAKGKDRILGVTIVGEHAGDLIAEYVLAMKHGLGLNKILGTIHIYPTLAEANKYAAGNWKRAHAPQGLLALVEKFHAWRRR